MAIRNCCKVLRRIFSCLLSGALDSSSAVAGLHVTELGVGEVIVNPIDEGVGRDIVVEHLWLHIGVMNLWGLVDSYRARMEGGSGTGRMKHRGRMRM